MSRPERTWVDWARLGCAVLVALGMFAAALGSGSGEIAASERPPAWVDVVANIVSAIVGLLVLIPRTQRIAAVCAVVMMLLSMGVNYMVDGLDFFLTALPFNLGVAILAIGVVVLSRRDPA